MEMHDYPVLLDRHVVGFCCIRTGYRLRALAGRLDRDGVSADAQPRRVEPRLAGLDVELPSVPGTAEDFTLPNILILAGSGRERHPGERALAQRSTLMWAPVAHGKKGARHVEHADGAPGYLHDLPRAGRNLPHRSHRVAGHSHSPAACWRPRYRAAPLGSS